MVIIFIVFANVSVANAGGAKPPVGRVDYECFKNRKPMTLTMPLTAKIGSYDVMSTPPNCVLMRAYQLDGYQLSFTRSTVTGRTAVLYIPIFPWNK